MDSIKEPGPDNTLMGKVNLLIAASNDLVAGTGQTTLALAGLASVTTLDVQGIGTGQVVDKITLNVKDESTYNATAAAHYPTTVNINARATRSAGSNDVVQYGLFVDAIGATENFSLYCGPGKVHMEDAVTMDTTLTLGSALVAAVADRTVVTSTASGTLNATAAGRYNAAGIFTASATRSAGANDVENNAIVASAVGGQVNYGIYTSASGGATNYAIDASGGGDVALCGASDKLGFHGSAPQSKGTVNGTVITATCGTALAQLLVLLGAMGLITDSHSNV